MIISYFIIKGGIVINLIALVDRHWAIGNQGQLLVSLPKDLAYFKEKTQHKVIVYGKKTLATFIHQQPLANRTNIMLTTDTHFYHPHIQTAHNLPSLFSLLQQYPSEDIFIIGGGQVYQQLLPYCHTAYITKVQQRYTADCHLDNLDELSNWHLIRQSSCFSQQGISFHFDVYQQDTVADFLPLLDKNSYL